MLIPTISDKEAKAILLNLAETACKSSANEVYGVIADMAAAKGFLIKPYEEAKAEISAG